MVDFKVSYILKKSEITLLLSRSRFDKTTAPARYLIKEYLTDPAEFEEDVEGLVFKKLARKDSEKIIIEPVIEFLVKLMISADRVFILNCLNGKKPLIIVSSKGLFLLVTDYSLIQKAWRITPFPNATELMNILNDICIITDIAVVSEDGVKCQIKYKNNFTWLEENGND